jgi:lambda family phage portal protein
MNWFEHALAKLSPELAMRRQLARHRLKVLGFYEAAEPSRYHKQRRDKRSANVQNERSAEFIRDQARHLDQNFDIASGALDTLVAFTIGQGISPEPQVRLRGGDPAESVNSQLLNLWDDWIHMPEVTRQFDYYSMQQILARSWFRDGEVFTQRIIGPAAGLDHGTIVPYSLEGLESDLVPYEFHDAARGIYQGIETDAWGKPRAYHVFKRHPGERYQSTAGDMKRVPAENILHLKQVKRLHQLRGMSSFATVINRADDLKEIDESERVAARVAAAFAAFIQKGTPDQYEGPDVNSPDGNRSMELVPGMIFDDLREGEQIGSIDPKRPNNALIPFRDSQLRSFAAGIRAGYSSISKNYNGSFSAQRQELVEQQVHYRVCSYGFVYRFAQPVYDGFIDAAVLSGKLKLPADVDMKSIYNASHSLPPMPWVDPLKEVNAAVIAIESGLKSRSRTIRERGDNPDQVNREIKRDQAEAERLGLKFGPAQPEPDPSEPTPPTEEPDPANPPDPDASSRRRLRAA